uniref:Ectonucleoside triphosphate diphosphohydrolase 1 n=1 Tax=Oncorhynchus mykiss TaxID=8022 RepID=A0A8C7TLE5_ONCMY
MEHRSTIRCKNMTYPVVVHFLEVLQTGSEVENVSLSISQYGIVLDAGSSHTAVYIYEWPAEKDNDTGRVQQTHSCKVQGAGISSYSVFPGQAGASLKSCMKEAESLIPLSRHHETPLYLGATAGMRLLRMENQSLSDQVLWSVEEVLRSSPFSYQGARIITGQEEGAFGWVTVNYLSDRLKQGSGTTGALDLGGASTQISFVANQDVAEESAENAVTFRLYGNDYFLYTHSFLCYGKDQALKLALAQQTQSGDSSVLDPCFHPGYSVDRSYFSVYSSPCVMAGKPLVSRDSFTHVGAGNASLCQEVVRRIFNFSSCSFSRCSFNRVYQPPLQGPFGAFSAFYFVMNFLNLTSGSLESSREKLERYCSRPWTQIKQQHPDVKEKYLAEYCFSGSYILSLLTDGYNFTSDTWTDITFIKKISGSDAGWTLGYMLNLTNMIPAEAPDTPPLPHVGYVTLLFFISLLLFFLLFLCFRFLRPRRNSQTQMI